MAAKPSTITCLVSCICIHSHRTKSLRAAWSNRKRKNWKWRATEAASTVGIIRKKRKGKQAVRKEKGIEFYNNLISKLLDIEEPTQGKQRKKRKGSSLKTSL